MRISLIIFAIAVVGFAHDAFAQAPKEVIVIDGQVGVNNFPASQTVNGTVSVDNLPAVQQVGGSVSVDNLPAVQDVWIQGATNPIPVVHVATPVGDEEWNRIIGPSVVGTLHQVVIPIPGGKLFALRGISITMANLHDNVVPICFIDIELFQRRFRLHLDERVHFWAAGKVRLEADEEWQSLPSASSVLVTCTINRADATVVTLSSNLHVSYYGRSFNSSTP